MTLRVVVADDQALVRTGFRMIIDAREDLEVVGEAADGAEAVRLTRELAPDVVLMDVRMPVLDGIGATRRIAEAGSRARILVAASSSRTSAPANSSRPSASPRAARPCSRRPY
jgi:DNA-binding NarL/FixJ family response regulator